MGIFDNVKDEMSDDVDINRILKKLNASEFDVSSVEVNVSGSTVILTGEAVSSSEKSKIAKLIEKIDGVETVKNKLVVSSDDDEDEEEDDEEEYEDDEEGDDEDEEESESTYYTVESGDTLGSIAKYFYGSSSKYTVIFEHNKQVWLDHGKKPDANVIFPGWEFEIPDL